MILYTSIQVKCTQNGLLTRSFKKSEVRSKRHRRIKTKNKKNKKNMFFGVINETNTNNCPLIKREANYLPYLYTLQRILKKNK